MSGSVGFRIKTGARIHFGLLDVTRPFGGIGVMIDQPSTIVEFQRGDNFFAEEADEHVVSRARAILDRVCAQASVSFPPDLSMRVIESTPGHHGLGSGTQLSMAIAEGAARLLLADDVSRHRIINIADRGKRSAVGSHGYFQGGLLYDDAEAGDAEQPSTEVSDTAINPICKRVELPEEWRLVLLIPRQVEHSVFGDAEQEKFAALSSSRQATEHLRSLAKEAVFPSAEAGEFDEFSRAIGRYNHDSGMLFADVQGGAYNGFSVESLVVSLQRAGVLGVGQSSWGPTVFAWCQSSGDAKSVAEQFASSNVRAMVVKPMNTGRQVLVRSDLE